MKDIMNIDNSIKKVLIIDDSELLHRMYDLIFLRCKNNGIRILHSYHGQDGLSELKRHPDTDLIILDIHMPVMNGLKAGAKAYLTKPFETANLYKVIDKLFDGAVYTKKDAMECSLK